MLIQPVEVKLGDEHVLLELSLGCRLRMKLAELRHCRAIHHRPRRPPGMVVLSGSAIEHYMIVMEQLEKNLDIPLEIEERERPRRLMNIGTNCAATRTHADPFQLGGGPVFCLKHASCLEQTYGIAAAVQVIGQHVQYPRQQRSAHDGSFVAQWVGNFNDRHRAKVLSVVV